MIKPIKEIVNSIENELRELQEGWYAEGFTDGYNKAIAKLSDKKSNQNELEREEQAEEWGKGL
jgi:TFIIF-interacting CTD phosphatase-like protein